MLKDYAVGRKKSEYLDFVKDDNLNPDKIAEMQFWICEYSKRKYAIDIQKRDDFEYIISKSKVGSDILNRVHYYVMSYANALIKYNGCKKNEYLKKINNMIISFHNYFYKFNPKYVILQEIFDSDVYSMINEHSEKLKIAERIHNDSENYGFIPLEITRIYNMSEIVKKKNSCSDFFYLNLQTPFLKKTKLDVDFNYKDIFNFQHFEEELYDGTIYLYMKCLEQKESLKDLVKEAIFLINKAMKKKNLHTAGCKIEADVQICINEYFYINNKSSVKEILEHSFAAYRNYYDPSIFLCTKDTLRMAKFVYVPRYEQVPFHIRAMGLWVWDKVNFENVKVYDAIKDAINIKEFCQNEHVQRSSIKRSYHLAERSVELMMPCIYSDL